MLNVLPPQQKIALKKEYSRRRIIVALGALCAVLIISLCLLGPSYFLTMIRANEARAALDRAQEALNSEILPKEVTTEVDAAVKNASALAPFATSTAPSVYKLLKVLEVKPANIQITQLSFSNGAVAGSDIVVRGKAPDRESLTAFGHALEGRSEFSAVDVPVSNFVRESDIDFEINLTIKNK